MSTHLAEIANRVTAFCISQRHHIEQKRLDVIVQCLVVEEKLGQQAQVLAVRFVSLAIHLPDAQLLFAIDLRPEKD